MADFVKSPLNYTGGKYKLLPQIMPLFPTNIDTFVDLFCGGGNVGINTLANHIIYNDKNHCLIELLKVFDTYDYQTIETKIEDNMITAPKVITHGKFICQWVNDLMARPTATAKWSEATRKRELWEQGESCIATKPCGNHFWRVHHNILKFHLSDAGRYGYAYYGCESSRGLGNYNKAPYMGLRKAFNEAEEKNDDYYLMLYTLIIYSFNNQIRFNSKGEFNLPVGKRDFNSNIRKNLRQFVEALHKQNCQFTSSDFQAVAPERFGNQDFVYCDPPYLISTASYNEANGWTEEDETNLLRYLDQLNGRQVRFGLSNVMRHKGRKNEILISWAEKYKVHVLNYNYNNSNYHIKNKNEFTEEVFITNY